MTPQTPAARRWGILVFLMALCFMGHFNRASITSAADERFIPRLGISPENMGLIYTAFLVVYTLFMIPGGWFVDRFGPRIALAVMSLGSALFCTVTGGMGLVLATGSAIWIALLCIRSPMGLSNAPLHPGAARACGNWFPVGEQSFANGLIVGASVFAYTLVHPVFGGLIDRFDWPTAFFITGGITAFLAVAWLVFSSDAPKTPQRQDTTPSPNSSKPSTPVEQTKGRRRNVILLTLSYAAVGYFQYLFFYWLHYYFNNVLLMEKMESRFYVSLPNFAMAISMPIGGWLTDRMVRRRGGTAGHTLIPKIAMTLSALFLGAGIFVQDRFWIVACFTAALGTLGLCEASFWTVALNIQKSRGGTFAAIMNTGGNGLGLLAPAITPWLGRYLGWGWGLGVGAIIGLLGAVCWWWIRLDEQPGSPTRDEPKTSNASKINE